MTGKGAGKPRCSRCGKRYRGHGEWNLTVRRGIVVGHLCPGCQTPEENAEALINFATLDYGLNEHGQLIARPRADS